MAVVPALSHNTEGTSGSRWTRGKLFLTAARKSAAGRMPSGPISPFIWNSSARKTQKYRKPKLRCSSAATRRQPGSVRSRPTASFAFQGMELDAGEQLLIGNLQPVGRLLFVPAAGLQRLQQEPPLHQAAGALHHLGQRTVPVEVVGHIQPGVVGQRRLAQIAQLQIL